MPVRCKRNWTGFPATCEPIGRRARRRALIWGLGALALVGCAGSGVRRGPSVAAAAEPPWLLPAESLDAQYLFRVRYQGAAGSGSVRLILRLVRPDRFQMQAADTFGRSLWSLELWDGRTLLVDHRRGTYCADPPELAIDDIALRQFDLAALPKLLLGRLPVAPSRVASSSPRRLDFRDEVDRRWRVRLSADRPVAWTMRRRGEAVLWWTDEPKGGILSHREGSQFRWRRTAVEPLPPGFRQLTPPDDYQRIPCHESDLPQLREDQPAPPGAGSAR